MEECMREFNVSTVNDVIDARKRKFLAKYSVSENSLCQVFARVGNLYDNCTHYVIHLHYIVSYGICYLVKFFSFFFLLLPVWWNEVVWNVYIGMLSEHVLPSYNRLSFFTCSSADLAMGYRVRGTRGLSVVNPPWGNLERNLVIRDKVGITQVSLWWAYPICGMLTFLPSVLWRCWLGDSKGIRPAKSWLLVCW